MSWHGYINGVLRPMREQDALADKERKFLIKTLRTTADMMEEKRVEDPVKWLRDMAKELELDFIQK